MKHYWLERIRSRARRNATIREDIGDLAGFADLRGFPKDRWCTMMRLLIV